MRWAVVCVGLVVALIVGCRPLVAPPDHAAMRPKGVQQPVGVLTDRDFVYPGKLLNTRDIAFYRDRLQRKLEAEPNGPDAPRWRKTIDFLAAARAGSRQAIRYRIGGEAANPVIEPYDWSPQVEVKQERTTRLLVIGGELESVVIALAAAERGIPTTLLYAGALGGLISDSGGNLRYLDGMADIPRPGVQVRLFREALGMQPSNLWVIPTQVSQRFEQYLRSRYEGRLTLVPTRSFDSLHVELDGEKITSLLTAEGTRLTARWYLDTDPECRVGEKAGVPYTIETPNLSCGMVFDLAGMRARDWLKLPSPMTAEQALALTGKKEADLVKGSPAQLCCVRMRKFAAREKSHYFGITRYGYDTLAEGFNLVMQVRGVFDPDVRLAMLNKARCTSGFNISMGEGRATFNSMSYQLMTPPLQHSHDLTKDDEFAAWREIEQPALERYFRTITGNPEVRVLLPPQFYVRKASAAFTVSRPYTKADFTVKPPRGLWMGYEMDLRDLKPRDNVEANFMMGFYYQGAGRTLWACRGSATECRVVNLYLLNKSSMNPLYYGGLRILQNLINTGVSLVDEM